MSSSGDESYSQPSVKLETESIVPLTNILNELVQLKYFLLTGPAQLRTQDGIHRHTLPNKDQISCVVWKNVYFITGTDIVRCLSFRFEAFGREITNRKKFEEGIFSDLRNLKCDTDAVLEQPKSEFLDYLYRNNCVRTQKKQKIFYWFSVNHDRLFQDALERDLKKELGGKSSSTTPVRDPALSFQYDGSRTLHDQLPDIIEKFPKPLAELADASSVMSNLSFHPGQTVPNMPGSFNTGQSMPPYQVVGDYPMVVNQPPILQSSGMGFYPNSSDMVLPSEGMIVNVHQPAQFNSVGHYTTRVPVQSSIPTAASHAFNSYSQDHHTQLDSKVSDFPLDYVEPTDASLTSQLFLEHTESNPDIYYYEDQYKEGEQMVVTDSFLQPYSGTDSKTNASITYDNQQFQVVYHQDATGNFTSSMVPVTENTEKESLRTPAMTPKVMHNMMKNSQGGTSSSLEMLPKKVTRIVEGQNGPLKRPASAGPDGARASMKKTRMGSHSYQSQKPTELEFQSATYFMLTPSDSGSSDVTQSSSSFLSESPGGFSSSSFRRPSLVAKRHPQKMMYQSSPVSQNEFFDDPHVTSSTYPRVFTSTSYEEGYVEDWL